MVGWNQGEAQILAALSRRPQGLSSLIDELAWRESDVASYHDLDVGVRRLVAAEYVEVTSRGLRLTKSGRALARRGSKGIRLAYQGIERGLAAAGPPPEPARRQFSEQDFDRAVAEHNARWERMLARKRRGRVFRSGD